jgi:hypothetical protein
MHVCRDGGFLGVSGGGDGSSGSVHLAYPTLRSSMTAHRVHCVSQESRRRVDRTPSMGVNTGLDWGHSGGKKRVREVLVNSDCQKCSKYNLRLRGSTLHPSNNFSR